MKYFLITFFVTYFALSAQNTHSSNHPHKYFSDINRHIHSTLSTAPIRAEAAQSILLKYQKHLIETQDGINLIYATAARFNFISLLSDMKKKNLLPNRTAYNAAFSCAAYNGHCEVIDFLKDKISTYSLSQKAINEAFSNAALNNQLVALRHLFLKGMKPDKNGANDTFIDAAINGNISTLNYLLTQPGDIPLPDKKTVNVAFKEAGIRSHLDVLVRLTTERSKNGILPRLEKVENITIMQTYISIESDENSYLDSYGYIKAGKSHTVDFLEGLLFPSINIHPVDNIHPEHEYIPHTPAEITHLNDAVMGTIFHNIKANIQLNEDRLTHRFDDWINSYYIDTVQNYFTKKRIRYGWKEDTLNKLSAVLEFLDQNHPDALNLWTARFLSKSMKSHKSRYQQTNHAACIDERIVESLRKIDTELDTHFFVGPEATRLRNFSFLSVHSEN